LNGFPEVNVTLSCFIFAVEIRVEQLHDIFRQVLLYLSTKHLMFIHVYLLQYLALTHVTK